MSAREKWTMKRMPSGESGGLKVRIPEMKFFMFTISALKTVLMRRPVTDMKNNRVRRKKLYDGK